MDAKVTGVEVEAIEYNPESATVRTQFDQQKTPPSMAVIATLVEATGLDPEEIDPLHSTIDPDALDSLVRVRNRTDGDSHVSFTHESHSVTVQSYGVVTITPESDPTAKTYDKEVGR